MCNASLGAMRLLRTTRAMCSQDAWKSSRVRCDAHSVLFFSEVTKNVSFQAFENVPLFWALLTFAAVPLVGSVIALHHVVAAPFRRYARGAVLAPELLRRAFRPVTWEKSQ